MAPSGSGSADLAAKEEADSRSGEEAEAGRRCNNSPACRRGAV